MDLRDSFSLLLDTQEVVALSWFFDTYVKKLQDGKWKDTMQGIADRFKDEVRNSNKPESF